MDGPRHDRVAWRRRRTVVSRRGMMPVSSLVSAVFVWTCSSAFQNVPWQSPASVAHDVCFLGAGLSVSTPPAAGVMQHLCHRSLPGSRACLGSLRIAPTMGEDHKPPSGDVGRAPARRNRGHKSGANAADRLRAVSRSDKSDPGLSPRATKMSPLLNALALPGSYPGRTMVDIPGTWLATGRESAMERRESQRIEDPLALWGLPHLEMSNGVRVEHGVASVGRSLLTGLPQLRVAAREHGVVERSKEKAKTLDEACKSYPQRWRVEGEGKYEQTSSFRFLDGWAETFPAVVDASSGSSLPPPPSRARTLLLADIHMVSLASVCISLLPSLATQVVKSRRVHDSLTRSPVGIGQHGDHLTLVAPKLTCASYAVAASCRQGSRSCLVQSGGTGQQSRYWLRRTAPRSTDAYPSSGAQSGQGRGLQIVLTSLSWAQATVWARMRRLKMLTLRLSDRSSLSLYTWTVTSTPVCVGVCVCG